jgi:hypothetical protein
MYTTNLNKKLNNLIKRQYEALADDIVDILLLIEIKYSQNSKETKKIDSEEVDFLAEYFDQVLFAKFKIILSEVDSLTGAYKKIA